MAEINKGKLRFTDLRPSQESIPSEHPPSAREILDMYHIMVDRIADEIQPGFYRPRFLWDSDQFSSAKISVRGRRLCTLLMYDTVVPQKPEDDPRRNTIGPYVPRAVSRKVLDAMLSHD